MAIDENTRHFAFDTIQETMHPCAVQAVIELMRPMNDDRLEMIKQSSVLTVEQVRAIEFLYRMGEFRVAAAKRLAWERGEEKHHSETVRVTVEDKGKTVLSRQSFSQTRDEEERP